MLDPDYIYNVADGAVTILDEMEARILARLVQAILNRARRNDDYIFTARDKWLVDTLQQSGVILDDITKIIAECTGYAVTEIAEAMVDAGVQALAWDERVYVKAGLPYMPAPDVANKALEAVADGKISITPTPPSQAPQTGSSAAPGPNSNMTDAEAEQAVRDALDSARPDDVEGEAQRRARRAVREDPATRRIIERDFKATEGEMRNLTQSVAYASIDEFVNATDEAFIRARSGECSYTQAAMDAAQKLADKGIKLKNRAGRNESLETAVTRCMRTAMARMAADVTMTRAKEMGVDTFVVSSHIGARYGDKGENPTNHWWWQGKVYQYVGFIEGKKRTEYPDFIKCTGFGSIEGLCGINCRHSVGPFIKGMKNNYPEYDESANEERYNTEQQCRAMERRIRALKKQIQALEALLDVAPDEMVKDIEEKLQGARGALKEANKAYIEFCKQNNLRPLTERLQVTKARRRANQNGG